MKPVKPIMEKFTWMMNKILCQGTATVFSNRTVGVMPKEARIAVAISTTIATPRNNK